MNKRWKALAGVTLAAALVFAPLAATGAMADEAVPPEETTEVVAVEEVAPPVEEAAPAAEPEVTTMGGHECEANRGYGHECPPPEPCTMGDSGGPEDCLIIPVLTIIPPTCLAPGSVVLSEHPHLVWSAVLNEDGSTTYTASSPQGPYYYQFPHGAQTVWTVPALPQLPEGSCGGGHEPKPVTLSPPTWTDECGIDNDFGYLPENTEGVSYEWADAEDPENLDVLAFVDSGYEVEDVPDGWALVGETDDEYIYAWSYEFSDEPCNEGSLDGSFITPVCELDAAYLVGTLSITDPDNQVPDDALATISMTDGVNTFTYPQQFALGPIRVLWPGATVDANGRGITWPGYITNADGTYTATDDPAYYGWTRGGVTVHVEVNPELDVEVDYPPASPLCLTSPPAPKPPTPAALAATGGGDVAPILPIAAGAAVVFGITLSAFGAIRRRIRG